METNKQKKFGRVELLVVAIALLVCFISFSMICISNLNASREKAAATYAENVELQDQVNALILDNEKVTCKTMKEYGYTYSKVKKLFDQDQKSGRGKLANLDGDGNGKPCEDMIK